MVDSMPRRTVTATVPAEVLQVATLRDRTLLRLKSWQSTSTGAGRPVELDGQRLPSPVGAVVTGPPRVLCIGPAEWLIVSARHSAATLRESIEPEHQAQGLSLADLTDGLAVFEVQGATSRAVLSKGCGLDLHPKAFPAGHCARTRFAQMPVVIDCLDAAPRFELHIARSYAVFLHDWLLDAALEFEAATA